MAGRPTLCDEETIKRLLSMSNRDLMTNHEKIAQKYKPEWVMNNANDRLERAEAECKAFIQLVNQAINTTQGIITDDVWHNGLLLRRKAYDQIMDSND